MKLEKRKRRKEAHQQKHYHHQQQQPQKLGGKQPTNANNTNINHKNLLTAEFLASPVRGYSGLGAEFGVDGKSGAETVAVAAKVASASVVHASLEIRRRIHHSATRREHRTVHHTAFLEPTRGKEVGVGKKAGDAILERA